MQQNRGHIANSNSTLAMNKDIKILHTEAHKSVIFLFCTAQDTAVVYY